MSFCFFARLAIAFPGVLEPDRGVPLPEGCSDMVVNLSWFRSKDESRVSDCGVLARVRSESDSDRPRSRCGRKEI